MWRIVTAVLLVAGIGVSWAAPMVIVADGRARARVVVPAAASDQVSQAAKVLVACVREASGAELPLVTEASAGDGSGGSIHIGPTLAAQAASGLPEELDDDGFVIAVEGERILILGPTDYGTEFGVYEFLERFVGVRWLLPGEHGTDIPRQRTIVAPEGRVVDQPVFMSRLFSGLRGPAQGEWARHNRMHGRISFHHNLGESVLPPERFRDTHPDFFPMKDGQARYLPADGDYVAWQPCFSAPGSVEAAVESICAAFTANPAATSFSLGVNDSSGHCRCPECLRRVPAEKNFLGLDNYSELYYDWCNRVIEGVLKEFPDKWFGCLAYSEVAAPPKTVSVHPRLIPYMTYDRMKWVHPGIREAGQAATVAWHAASPTLGWYDYIYGTPYCLPRVWFHHSQSYLQFARDTGVRAHYAEIYPNWGEGPKPYVFLKLWWNPDRNVDALLDEWYRRCVGPAAAPALRQYYAIWERFWTRDILDSQWFSVGGQYLNFSSPGYLADVRREDIAASRRLLDEVLAKCRTDDQRARARLLETAFQYYEASALAFLANSDLQMADVSTEAQALRVLDRSAEGLAMAERRRHLALNVFPDDPVLVHPLPIGQMGLGGQNWGGSGLWAMADWVARGDNAVRRRVQQIATGADLPALRDQAAMLLAVVDGSTPNLLQNGSFEEGQGEAADAWGYWLKPDEPPDLPIGDMLRSQDVAHSGTYSLLCDGMFRGGPVQAAAFPGPGRYYALCWVYAPEGQHSRGTTELSLTPLDERGQNLPGYSSRLVPPAGRWTLLVAGADIPGAIEGKPVAQLRPIPIVDGFQDGGRVYLDDVGLYRLP